MTTQSSTKPSESLSPADSETPGEAELWQAYQQASAAEHKLCERLEKELGTSIRTELMRSVLLSNEDYRKATETAEAAFQAWLEVYDDDSYHSGIF